MNCASCQHFSLRSDEKGAIGMASQGFGICAFRKHAGQYVSAVFERHCDKHKAAPDEVTQGRLQWLDKKQKEFMNKWRVE